MCTVLITYSTPQPPGDTTAPGAVADARGAAATTQAPGATGATGAAGATGATGAPSTPSFADTTAGIDEAIAAAVADELTRAGHRVACRPSVAVTTTNGFDLVVGVHHLRVSHWRGGRPRPIDPEDPEAAEPGPAERRAAGEDQQDVASTIPMTWCADWRAVDAWARSIGDHLVHVLELRTELARVRAELDRCRAMLLASTPEPRALSAAELGRPSARGSAPGVHRAHRRIPDKQTTGT